MSNLLDILTEDVKQDLKNIIMPVLIQLKSQGVGEIDKKKISDYAQSIGIKVTDEELDKIINSTEIGTPKDKTIDLEKNEEFASNEPEVDPLEKMATKAAANRQ